MSPRSRRFLCDAAARTLALRPQKAHRCLHSSFRLWGASHQLGAIPLVCGPSTLSSSVWSAPAVWPRALWPGQRLPHGRPARPVPRGSLWVSSGLEPATVTAHRGARAQATDCYPDRPAPPGSFIMFSNYRAFNISKQITLGLCN